MKTMELTAVQAEALSQVLQAAPVRGYTFGDVKMGVDVMAALKPLHKDGGPLTLEDTPYEWLCRRIDEHVWPFAGQIIVDLVATVKGAVSP